MFFIMNFIGHILKDRRICSHFNSAS